MGARKKKIERRRHKRFSAKEKTFAFIRSQNSGLDGINQMSMGEIACAVYKSKPVKIGQVIDMSQGGLSFDCVDGAGSDNERFFMDILSADDKFHMSRIKFKTVRETRIKEAPSLNPITVKKQGVQFVELTFKQISKLEDFLRNHTDGEFRPEPE